MSDMPHSGTSAIGLFQNDFSFGAAHASNVSLTENLVGGQKHHLPRIAAQHATEVNANDKKGAHPG